MNLPNLAAMLIPLAAQRAIKRFPERYSVGPRVHGAVIISGALSLWLYLTRWVLLHESGFYLTATLACLALLLFVAGVAVRERVPLAWAARARLRGGAGIPL